MSDTPDASAAKIPPDGTAHDRPRLARQLLWLATALILVSGLAVTLALQYTRVQAHEAGEALTGSFARIVQEQTDRTLQNVDLRLQLVDANLQQMRAEHQLGESSARTMLNAQLRELPYVRALWVLDANGRIQFDSGQGNIGVDLSHRAYFQTFLTPTQTRVYLSAPVRSRVNNTWILILSRGVFKADGTLERVVVAAIEPAYFERLWQQLGLGAGGSVSLFRSDSVLMIRSPHLDDSIGKTFLELPYFNLPPEKRKEGTFERVSALDGVHRHFAYRTLAQFPATVIVGKSHEVMLMPWQRMATLVVAIWAIGATLASLLCLYLARDIRARFKTEDALRDSDLRWRFALEGAGDGIWDWNVPGKTVFYSPRWAEMLGYAPEEVGNTGQEWLSRVHPDDAARSDAEMMALVFGKTDLYINEHRLRCKDGSYKWILARGIVVARSPGGKTLRVVGTNADITESKLNQEAIKLSLAEKTALLNEVHHRVKNNLQVVTSLLRLEAGRSVQPDTKTVLKEMQGRVRAMALLHESLYRSGIFASVDLGNYLKQLATQAFRALAAQGGNVRLSLNLGTVTVSMDLATPCGLLVNELISNALKHGFPQGQAGEVLLELQPVPDSALVRLRVSDTGVGLPDDFDAHSSPSLGLHLASDLARQMGGHLDIGPGALFEVQFPLEVPRSQAGGLT